MSIHIDKNIGFSGSAIHWMRSEHGKYRHWCKMAVAIMGRFNMTDEEIATLSPFDPRFNDNYVEGKGATKEEAFANMELELKNMADAFWAT
jgi:hypothetical protein